MDNVKRVLIVNKFYYPAGGDCTYTLNLERLLKANGFEVAIFAMQQPQTLETKWVKYFPSEINYAVSGAGSFWKSLLRPLGAREVKRNFSRLLDDFQPDVVHLNNIHTQLSPVIAELAYKRKIKVVWTLHDYKLLCPRSDCLRYGTQICESCFSSKWNVVKYRCTKNSLAASFLAYIEAKRWNRKRLEKYTSVFICPSKFMKSKMLQGGFSEEKLRVLNNFVDERKVKPAEDIHSDYYCYVGRISREKGVITLLKVASQLPYQLKVLGSGPLLDSLREQYNQENIEFLGHRNWEEVKPLLGRAKFSVLPSEWYENNPFGMLESFCLGTPVIGANSGGIPELIREGVNGYLFEPRNEQDLQKKIEMFYKEDNRIMNAKDIASESCEKYSDSSYFNALKELY